MIVAFLQDQILDLKNMFVKQEHLEIQNINCAMNVGFLQNQISDLKNMFVKQEKTSNEPKLYIINKIMKTSINK